jgi:hypothetical protein
MFWNDIRFGLRMLRRDPAFRDSRSLNSGVVEGYSPKPNESVRFETVQVGPAYPDTLSMSLLQGRPIGVEDVEGTPRVGVVNAAFVRRYSPTRIHSAAISA